MFKNIVVIFIFTAFFSGCRSEDKINKITFNGLGTVLSVIYAGERDIKLESSIRKDAETVEKELSYYKKDSFVSLINTTGYKATVKVPIRVCKLIEKSIEFGKKTEGVFDITYKSEGILWKNDAKEVPTKDQIAAKKDLVGVNLIKVDCMSGIVKTARKGVLIDLGGIAKGYAIDRAGDILKAYEKKDFIINYGGDMLVCGSKGKKKWTVGIKNPENNGRLLKTLKFGSKDCHGIATSGDYERFIEINGRKYSHIFDPRSGRPVNGSSSVTVVAKDSLTADVIATAVSVGHSEDDLIKKIMEKFSVRIYTLDEKNSVLKKWD